MKKQKQQKLFSKKTTNKSKKKENSKKGSVQFVEQKESSQKNSSKIEDILNHPISKRRLPPIEKRQNTETNEAKEDEKIEVEIEQNNDNKNFNLEDEINNNIQNLNFVENENDEQIKDSLEIENMLEKNKNIEDVSTLVKNTVDNVEKKINIIVKKIKSEIGTGTPYYCDNLKDIKNEVDNKTKIITKLSEEQNNYKFELNELIIKLNQLIKDNATLLYSDDIEDEEKKLENLNELKMQLELKKKGINSSKNQNKIYKQQYDLLSNKEKTSNNENIEKKIDKIKLENSELIKQIKTLKSQSRKDGKKLEDFNLNGKYLQDINKTYNELKTLENKKHEYFKKLSDNNKFINNCVKELENLEKFYETQKNTKNYFNAKVEEEINRLKEDLSGNEEEIIKRIETDSAFIIKKMIHNEKMRENLLRTPAPNKPLEARKMKLKKGNSLEPLAKLKIARNNIHSGGSRRMNIVAKNKSPISTNINNNKEKDDFDPNKINYNDLTDYEYKEMINKKEHCNDVVTKLEKSIREAQKMYQRKVKEIKLSLEQKTQQLSEKNKENESLKSEIDDLTKILSIAEQENKINTVQPPKPKKSTKNLNKTNTNLNNNDKELESQKEYLSPEYYSNNNNNNKSDKDKEKVLMPTHSNTDMTRNEILNDLKVLNGPNLDEGAHDSLLVQKNNGKISNFAMKFPDLSNIEENINVNINPSNEFERNKAIDDIKKKYNIKMDYNVNNDDDLNDELNLEEENEEEKILKEQERLKKEEIEERQRLEKEIEDEKKFFKEHEKILNNEEEGQFEPPIQNNIYGDNLFDNRKEDKENNINTIEKEEKITNVIKKDKNDEINNQNEVENKNENKNDGDELEKDDNKKDLEEIKKNEEINNNDNQNKNKNIQENNDDSLEQLSDHNKEHNEIENIDMDINEGINKENKEQKEDNMEQHLENEENNVENENINDEQNEEKGEQENNKEENELEEENNKKEEIEDDSEEKKEKEEIENNENEEIYTDNKDEELKQDNNDKDKNENSQEINDENGLNNNEREINAENNDISNEPKS